MTKHYLFLILLLGLNANAKNSDLTITTNITSGCRISFPNIDFGIVSEKSSWQDGTNRIIKPISIFCSKGTSFVLTGDVAKNGYYNSISNITKNSYAHPLFGLSENNSDYLGFVVVAPRCGEDNNPLTHKLSGGSNPITGTSNGEAIYQDICFSLKGMKGFPGYGVQPDAYSGHYNFYLNY